LDVAEELSDRVAIINQGTIVAEKPTQALIAEFSSSIYTIELAQPLDPDRQAKLQQLGIDTPTLSIQLPDPQLLYPVLDILRPLPIVKVEQDRANLTDVFLRVVQERGNV
jgi:ABC-2 type transport system ATP-binding protein